MRRYVPIVTLNCSSIKLIKTLATVRYDIVEPRRETSHRPWLPLIRSQARRTAHSTTRSRTDSTAVLPMYQRTAPRPRAINQRLTGKCRRSGQKQVQDQTAPKQGASGNPASIAPGKSSPLFIVPPVPWSSWRGYRMQRPVPAPRPKPYLPALTGTRSWHTQEECQHNRQADRCELLQPNAVPIAIPSTSPWCTGSSNAGSP